MHIQFSFGNTIYDTKSAELIYTFKKHDFHADSNYYIENLYRFSEDHFFHIVIFNPMYPKLFTKIMTDQYSFFITFFDRCSASSWLTAKGEFDLAFKIDPE